MRHYFKPILFPNMKVERENIHISGNWISINDIGRIGLYASYKKSILLDYSMKWIVGTNEDIPCTPSEIKDKILNLFNNERKEGDNRKM